MPLKKNLGDELNAVFEFVKYTFVAIVSLKVATKMGEDDLACVFGLKAL